eukprot:2094106-Pleurochrysis_carterae.AAC.1
MRRGVIDSTGRGTSRMGGSESGRSLGEMVMHGPLLREGRGEDEKGGMEGGGMQMEVWGVEMEGGEGRWCVDLEATLRSG